MKHLPLFAMMAIAAPSLMACSSDTDDSSGNAATSGAPAAGGSAGQGGSPASGGQPVGGGGAGTNNGGSSAGGMGGSGGGVSVAKDIVDTAVAAGSFTQLAAALQKAGLVETLKGTGPFTVFAPTDAAFAAFEKDKPGALAKLTTDELGAVLKYHVVSGAAVKSTELKDEQVFSTVLGSPLLVDTTGGVKVADAKVAMADVVASNGIIHVIDKIMLPPSKDIIDTAVMDGRFTKLAGALMSAGLVETLKGKGPFTVFAPTDAAFDKLGAAPTGDALKNVLLYHVVAGAVGSGDLKAGMVLTQLMNKSVTIKLDGGVQVDAAKVTMANIVTKNGVIHVVDTVLVPQ